MPNNVTPIDSARSPLAYALRYARIGWHVIPGWWAVEGEDGAWRCSCGNPQCRTPAKHPISRLVPRGLHDATTDEVAIERWWRAMPRANICVVLAPSHLVAIDIDPRNGGDASIEDLEARHGLLRSDVLQLTGGGGEHRVFSVPAGQGLQLPGQLGPGIDVKHNGYIVVEPSNHVSGGSYQWEASSDPLEGVIPSPLPDWLRSVRVDQLPQEHAARTLDAGEVLELQSALFCLDPDGRETWLNVGMALHATGAGQQAYGIWAEWSRQSEKFDPVDQLRVWRSFKARGLSGLSAAWIFAQAQAAGWVNPRSRSALSAASSIDALLKSAPVVQAPANEPEEPRSVAEMPEVPAHLMTIPGALGRAVDWIAATAHKPQPLFDVQAALGLGSVACARRYRTDNNNWSSLYLVNVGRSGSGKEHAKHAIEQLLDAGGLGHLVGPGRFASESGVLSCLLQSPATIAIVDEFGKTLEEASHPNNIMAHGTLRYLLEVFGRAGGVLRPVAYSTAGMSSRQSEEMARRFVRNPGLTLFGMTTPEPLFAAVGSGWVRDGSLNRLIVVHSEIGRQPARRVRPVGIPADLVEWLQEIRARNPGGGNLGSVDPAATEVPTPTVLEIKAAALAMFDAFERDNIAWGDRLDEEGLGEMTTRMTELSMRVALIVALSCGSETVRADDASWAIEYVRIHAQRNVEQLRAHLADSPFERLVNQIKSFVLRAGARGATVRDLQAGCRAFRAAPSRLADDALARLVHSEQIHVVEMKSMSGRGRPRKAFVAGDGADMCDKRDEV